MWYYSKLKRFVKKHPVSFRVLFCWKGGESIGVGIVWKEENFYKY